MFKRTFPIVKEYISQIIVFTRKTIEYYETLIRMKIIIRNVVFKTIPGFRFVRKFIYSK